MTVPLVFICFVATINILTSGSRMIWAFARERGLPCSSWLARIHTGRGRLGLGTTVPLNAIAVMAAVACLLVSTPNRCFFFLTRIEKTKVLRQALINVGSSVAFSAFTSLVVVANYATFLLSAAVLLHRRLTVRHEEIPFGPFNLGRVWGVPVILCAMAYAAVGAFFSFWPPHVDPSPETMNWSVVVFGGGIVWSLLYWALWGRKVYTGPVLEVDAGRGVGGGGVKRSEGVVVVEK